MVVLRKFHRPGNLSKFIHEAPGGDKASVRKLNNDRRVDVTMRQMRQEIDNVMVSLIDSGESCAGKAIERRYNLTGNGNLG